MRNSQKQILLKLGTCPAYSLLDSGNAMKLENFAGIKVIRPEPKAWWGKTLSDEEWALADAEFSPKSGLWKLKNGIARQWIMKFNSFSVELRFNDNSKHLGIFPEQEPHWRYIQSFGEKAKAKRLLNLFGYTGAATLAALSTGFSVTHVDASAPSISWAKRNLEISGMKSKPVRWILDDAIKFVRREIRRGNKYDAIVMDPPAFGRGPNGEIWKIENSLRELLFDCKRILSDAPIFVILTIYNIEASSLMSANLLEDVFGSSFLIENGELGLEQVGTNKILPLALCNICQLCVNNK